MKVNFRSLIVLVNLVLTVAVFQSKQLWAAPVGIDTEGCTGDTEDSALKALKGKLPPGQPVEIGSCDKDHSSTRCDGGFMWQPYMVNQDRAWVFYTAAKRDNWVTVNVHNICSDTRVLKGDFLNGSTSPYLMDNSAFALGRALDDKQALLQGYDNTVMQLSRDELGNYWVHIYGLDDEQKGSVLLDSFTVDPL